MRWSEHFVQVVMVVIFLQYFGIKSWQRYQAKKVISLWWGWYRCWLQAGKRADKVYTSACFYYADADATAADTHADAGG